MPTCLTPLPPFASPLHVQVWQWPPEGKDFYESDSFRKFLREQLLEEEHAKLLAQDEGPRAVEKPAEAALRKRM